MYYFKQVFCFFKEIYQNRRLIYDLSKRDFKERYVSSYLGILWAFIQPLVNVLVFWLVIWLFWFETSAYKAKRECYPRLFSFSRVLAKPLAKNKQ